MLRPHARPDRIKGLQPPKQQRILPARHGAGEVLIEVVMGVDEPRRHHGAAGVHGCLCPLQTLPDLNNHTVPNADVGGFQHPPVIIHGQQGFGIFQKKISHDFTLQNLPVS